MSSPGPRIAPLSSTQSSDAVREALLAAVPADTADRLLSPDPDSLPMPNALGTLLHNPPLASAFFGLNRMLLHKGTLPDRWRELVVLRVAWRTQSGYEWAQHTRLAARVGVTQTEIDAIPNDPAHSNWSIIEVALLTATDELIDHYSVSDSTWQQLTTHLDPAQLVELHFLVGAFVCVAMALNSLGVHLDRDIEHITIPPLNAPGHAAPTTGGC